MKILKKLFLVVSTCSLLLTSCNDKSQSIDVEGNSSYEQQVSSRELEPFLTTHEHTFDEKWENDETNHWHKATCGHDFAKDLGAHIYGEDNICDVCGYTKPSPIHEHTYDLTNWVTTSTHHWHESNCGHEGLATNVGEHTYNIEGKCTICGHIREVEMFTFTFKSDYCDLNNNEFYQEGEKVELSLTLKEAYQATFYVPNEIEVYSNGILLTKGNDYKYVIENNVGNLSLTVSGNIIVQAYRSNDESAFQVNEEEFLFATDASNFDYLQYELYYMRFGGSIILLYDYLVEYCPTVVYRARADLTTSTYSGSLYYDYSYIEYEDAAYTQYTYSNSSEGWKKSESNETDFNDYKIISLTMLPFLYSQFVLSYDSIKDNYNSVTNAYELQLKVNSYNVKFQISFYEGKIININYSDDSNYGFFANADLSYQENEIIIPEDVKPHVHKFSSDWTSDSTHHWHAATCEHTDEKGSYELHNFDETGKCSVCGYVMENSYPVITKVINNNLMAGSPDVYTRVWADDYSNVITSSGVVYPHSDYISFDQDGNIIEEGRYEEEQFIADNKYFYEDGLIVEELSYENGQVNHKEIYNYDENSKKLMSYKLFDVNGGIETLKREENYEYADTYRHKFTMEYEGEIVSDFYYEEWLFSSIKGGTRETYYRKHGLEGDIKKIGYLDYNKLGQIIATKDTFYTLGSSYYGYKYITYLEDGNLSTVTSIDDNGDRSKDVYSYDENGFIEKKESFEYNSSSKAYDILVDGYDYDTDDKGTIIKKTYYNLNNGYKEERMITEYEIKYVPKNFKITYFDYLGETKGTYNAFEISNFASIG